MTHQALFQIRFRLAGPALDQVIHWQRETDRRVIGYQIETRGSAVAVMYEGKIQLHSIKQVPPPGQSIPWYGDDGSSYQFTFRPTDEGYRLRVEMTLAGREFFFADAIAPLELTVPELIRIEPATDDQLWWGMDWGWWCGPAGGSEVEALTFILNLLPHVSVVGRVPSWKSGAGTGAAGRRMSTGLCPRRSDARCMCGTPLPAQRNA